MDYHVVLGIAEEADEDTVRSAFRALAVISNEVVHSGPPWKEWALPHVPFSPRGAPSETSS